MRSRRRIRAVLSQVVPEPAEGEGERCAVAVRFEPSSPRVAIECVEARLPLGPELDVEVVHSLSKLVRLLRAARVAPPANPHELLGDTARAAALLERALGTEVVLELVPRSSVRFTVWTDAGVESVRDVVEVLEDETAWLVRRGRGQELLRVPRESVVRQQTDCETWFEITGIERVV